MKNGWQNLANAKTACTVLAKALCASTDSPTTTLDVSFFYTLELPFGGYVRFNRQAGTWEKGQGQEWHSDGIMIPLDRYSIMQMH